MAMIGAEGVVGCGVVVIRCGVGWDFRWGGGFGGFGAGCL